VYLDIIILDDIILDDMLSDNSIQHRRNHFAILCCLSDLLFKFSDLLFI